MAQRFGHHHLGCQREWAVGGAEGAGKSTRGPVVSLARELGVSPRRLLGWEPGEVTTYEYDDDGRLLRAVTVREPEYSAWDRAVLLADVAASKVPRGHHGVPLHEAADPENQFAFEVPPPRMDWAQKALDDAQEAFKKQNPKAPMGALMWKVARRG